MQICHFGGVSYHPNVTKQISSYFSQCAYVILEHEYIIVIIVGAIFVVVVTYIIIVVDVVVIFVDVMSVISRISFVIIYVLKQGQTSRHSLSDLNISKATHVQKRLLNSQRTLLQLLFFWILRMSTRNLKFINDFTPCPSLNGYNSIF